LSVTDPTSVAPALDLSVEDRSPRLASTTPGETFGLLRDDRGLFAEAQGLLAEVSGCPLRRASNALLLTAAHQHVHVRQIAQRFVDTMANQHEGRQDALVIDLVAAALSADTTGPTPGAFAAGDPQRFDAAPPDLIGPARLGHIRGVSARGELELLTAGELLLVATENRDAIGGETVDTAFYVDLEGVTFLDAAGLGALAGISNQARDQGQRLLVSTPTAAGPRNLLALAVARGWLVPEFAPADHDTSSGVA
jgi:ABC-type transporter Mla MlaB component